MTTFSQLKEEVLQRVRGFSDHLEKVTSLNTGIDADDLTMQVGEIQQVSRGLIEIDNELLYVRSVDKTSSTVNIYPWGRGYAGTTAASHSANAKVSIDPTFPRNAVASAINEVVLQVFPDIFDVKATNLTSSATQIRYELPSDAQEIFQVRWEVTGPTLYRAPVRRWSPEPRLEGDSVPLAVNIFDAVEPGRTIRVLYKAKPTVFTVDADTLGAHGFSESAKDVLVYGAVARLLSSIDVGKFSDSDSPSATAMTGYVQPGVATQVARQMYAQYQQRLSEERARLLSRFQPRSHFTQ